MAAPPIGVKTAVPEAAKIPPRDPVDVLALLLYHFGVLRPVGGVLPELDID